MPSYIYYWSPCLNKVGTVKSTINSVLSLSKYSNSKFVPVLINACGEWDEYKVFFKSNNIKIANLSPFNYYKYLPKTGYVASRFSYILIYLISFFPLLLLLKTQKPKTIILHLITSLPLTLLSLFQFETNFILRISGYPKLNILRKFFWIKISKKLKSITCPTVELRTKLINNKIFPSNKLFYLPDAIIDIGKFSKYLDKKIHDFEFPKNKKIILSAGRLTKQKNFSYLINEFTEFCKKNDQFILVILGEGEERKKLEKNIREKKLDNRIFLLGHKNDIFTYMKKSELFVLSSLWEEPGFVIVEAALSNLYIVSSNCPNGPVEFLNYGKNGILFNKNEKNALSSSLLKYIQISEEKKFYDKCKLKKNSLKYTKFRHFIELNRILNQKND